MATNKLQWKRIAMGDKLPCQSFLRKKNGEILNLSTVTGVKVGQDAYYLPVDDVIEEIRNYPIEESKGEKIRKTLVAFFTDWHKTRSHCWGISVPKILAWLEKQGEQKPWSEEDENLLKLSLENLTELKDRFGEEYGKVGDCIVFLESIKDRYTWRPSDEHLIQLSNASNGLYYNCETLLSLLEQLNKLREE